LQYFFSIGCEIDEDASLIGFIAGTFDEAAFGKSINQFDGTVMPEL
jgi:hypothetical protein